MMKIEKKSFILGAGTVALLSLLFIFRDSLFVRKVSIEILDRNTKQVSSYAGPDGHVFAIIDHPQVTTDWSDRFDVHAFRKFVRNGEFWIPARFYKYVAHPDCIEAGCNMTLSFEGYGGVFCRNIESSSRYRMKDNSIVFQCD